MQARNFLLLFFLSPLALLAQTSTIRGLILDKQSETPLIGATVQLLNANPAATPQGSVTDADGRFALRSVPVGRQALRISYLGYETQTIPNILVTAGKEVQLDLRLEESFNKMAEVVITAKTDKDKPMNEMATISARQFNTEEVMRYSGGRNDVAKLVANFAGVAANNDARNDIVIRGNSPTGVLWRMEGIPMPNPNHFSTLGTTGGPVSALNPNLIANSDFLTGAFPAEYGNALAGVFDINLRSGNKERFEFLGQLGAFSGMEALVEGPISKKNNSSFVAAYRHSFAEVAQAAGLNVGTKATPRYKDLSFNVDLGHSKVGKFSIFGIGATSAIDFIGKDLDTTDLFADPNQDSYSRSKFGVLGLKHNLLLNDHTYVRTVLSASYSGTTYWENQTQTLDENGDPLRSTDVEDGTTTYRLSSYYNNKVNARLTLRGGFLWQYQQLDTKVQTRDYQPDRDGDGRPDWFIQRDFDGGFHIGEAFVQGQYRLTQTLSLNAGAHALYFDKTEDAAIEPRAALNWQFTPRQSLNLGYGLHHQNQPLPVFLFRER